MNSLTLCGVIEAAPNHLEPGLAAIFTTVDDRAPVQMDHATAERIAIYVPAGTSPTPFLEPGRFRVEWSGFLSLDLRGEMFFQSEANGLFTLVINDQEVLRHDGTGNPSPLSHPIRLNKGTNRLTATLTSPVDGDTWVRLSWGEEETLLSPVSGEALNRSTDQAALNRGSRRRQGRELALEHRCFHCHIVDAADGLPELSMDAPTFEGMGARRNQDWLAEWILDPHALRRSATMPRMFHDPGSQENARAVATFLASLQTQPEQPRPPNDGEADREAEYTLQRARELGQDVADTWYRRLHCSACHGELEDTESSPSLIALDRVSDKFPAGKLTDFLRKPNAHYAWTRMPDFHLTEREASALEATLRTAYPSKKQQGSAASKDSALVLRGRKLVQDTGCLNCHTLTLENRFRTMPWSELRDWNRGCLDGNDARDSRAPRYDFGEPERAALMEFARTGVESLHRHVPTEFANRWTRRLQCVNCHGALIGVPPWGGLGGKLKPDWMEQLLNGTLPEKPRPWLPARMPSFSIHAKTLAQGLAMSHGWPPVTGEEPDIDPELAKIGHRLVGKDGGFSCVSCHGIGDQKPTEVFEAEGINLARVADRLQKDYYRRWMLAPSAIDPQTKMPMYFDQGFSPLTEVLDGDADRQIEALWEYFRLRDEMPSP